jgi:hypothetical protein
LRQDEAAVADLRIDLKNPRVPDAEFSSEEDAIEYLINHADVDELVQSIGRSGWLDFEPLIILEPSNIVIEGNRRLAALRLISDPELRARLKYRLPVDISPSVAPTRVRAFIVAERAEARDFIGFKHINGAYKWDSLAKARYAAEWLDDDPDTSVKIVSERLGDSHNTVLRLVNGFRVLQEAERLGFNQQVVTSPRGFSFSHLYTALPSPSVRRFLGIDDDAKDVLTRDPIPESHEEKLMEYMTWLYGQDGRGRHVVVSQNPDLGKLSKVLTSNAAINMLRVSHDLSESYDLVEDKGKAFEAAIFALLKTAREAASQVGKYDGDPEVFNVAQTASHTVRGLLAGMKAAVEDVGAGSGKSD